MFHRKSGSINRYRKVFSAQWTKETVEGYTRLVNRWKPNQVIHTENDLGYLEASAIHSGAWKSQWSLK
ncbi:RICIN domain-containing protein [Candidatus Enterococcus mangumiae]|uniref:Transposase n=1 Tax=Candidatus Enterococcus mangumiae TaxID=2230878 RepID=A0ABZ2SX35_9ENTE|nr:hypothetical protein [Enterococcus sp. DIV1094]MBO0489328.1 hypothetical protein [Enterococcus sp. DIV1094]